MRFTKQCQIGCAGIAILGLWLALDAQAQQQAAPAGESPATLHLLVGRSLIINSPQRLSRVSIVNPDIADAIVVTPTQVQINGKTPGAVSLVVWDENHQSQTFDLFVDRDAVRISQAIRESFPDEPVRVEVNEDVLTVSGRVSTPEVAEKIVALASASAPKVVSLLQAEPPQEPEGEVLLQVRFAEVDRAALTEFGFNFISFPGSPLKTTTSTSTQQFGPPQLEEAIGGAGASATFNLADLLNVFIFRPDVDLAATIRAMQQQNLLQILAEPNLLTKNGTEAYFLAGGEFPIPVVQGGTNFTAVTIQFKEFGVRLNFTPTIQSDGRIHLKVAPEVSALDFANALTISGFVVPAISTRRVVTEMDLGDGQSFAIAGLVDDRLTEIARKIPFLGDIPILGHLFRSRSTNRAKTELLVVVTPRIVRPAPEQPLPTEPQFPRPFLPPAAAPEEPNPETNG